MIHARRSIRRGGILLEVVLSLAIFVSTGSILITGAAVSADTTARLREQGKAADLARSVLAEIQAGIIAAEDIGPEPFEAEYLEGWTWQVVTEEPNFEGVDEQPAIILAQVIVRNENRQPAVTYQITQWVRNAGGIEQAEDFGP